MAYNASSPRKAFEKQLITAMGQMRANPYGLREPFLEKSLCPNTLRRFQLLKNPYDRPSITQLLLLCPRASVRAPFCLNFRANSFRRQFQMP